MFDAGDGQHFYVFELLSLNDGCFFIPIRWVVHKKRVHADAYAVTIDSQVKLFQIVKTASDPFFRELQLSMTKILC